MHTFVIPVYKESPYLEHCIQSLINQTVKSDILITTSTPTDYTRQIANKYKLNYYVGNEKGIANDWNFALSKATTPLATIAHQDDIYEPDYTANVINSIVKNKTNNVLIAFTGYTDLVDNKARAWSLNSVVKKALLFPFFFSDTISNNYLKKLLLLFGDPICCPSVTYNLEALAGFKFSTNFTCTLDWHAWYLLAKQPGAFCFINKKLIKHRIHPESETTVQLSQGIRKQEELQILKMMWDDKTAAFIAWIYTLGHADNKLNAD